MHFCVKCDNMYYMKLKKGDTNKLIYYCRNCQHEADDLTESDVCVLKTQVKRNEEKYTHVINEYTKEDPTLPRIKTIKCPNQDCPSNKSELEREVIYIRYDDSKMKYVYMCVGCNTMWKTSEQK